MPDKYGRLKVSVPLEPDVHKKVKALAKPSTSIGKYIEALVLRHVAAQERKAAK